MDQSEQRGLSDSMDDLDSCCLHNNDSILALKIYDKCKDQACNEYGPAISEEPCECIILEHCEYPYPMGRFIFPGRPITLPDEVAKVKLVEDSFRVQSIGAMVAQPSRLRNGYWDIEVQVNYEFKLQFFGQAMCLLSVKCLAHKNSPTKKHDVLKDHMCASICTVMHYSLYGGGADSTIVASELFCQQGCSGRPQALVEFKAYPLDTVIVCIRDSDCCDDVFDCVYEEVLRYVYLTIGSYMLLFLFRIVSLLIETKGFSIPEDYVSPEWDPCKEFLASDFGNDLKS